MKCLILVRHAKSSWNHPDLSDFDRPLNKRGERDAPAMAARLAEKLTQPALIVSSPAARSLATAHAFAGAMRIDTGEIMTDPDLYGAEPDEFITIIRALDNTTDTVLLVSHNPGITELVNELSGSEIDNLPTCSVCRVDFDIGTWNDVAAGRGTLAFFDYPKKF